jgi:putative transposase
MEEKGIEVNHATIQRWVIKYTPLLRTENPKRKKAVGSSWRIDESNIKVIKSLNTGTY